MIEGLHFVRYSRPDGPATWYVYAWRGGPRIMTARGDKKPNLDQEALRKLSDALDAARPRPGDSLDGLITMWRGGGTGSSNGSPEWNALEPTTRDTWGRALDLIEARWGKTPLAVWNDARMVAKVVEWRDSRASTPRAADVGVTVLSRLLEFGRLRAKVTVNVAAGIPSLYHGADRAEIIWLPEDMDAFMLAALQRGRPEVIDALWLAALTGMRRADLAGLTFAETSSAAIVRKARKKSRGKRRRAVIPVLPETELLLEELRDRERESGVDTVLVNSKGRPWTPGSLTQAFNEVRDLANDARGIVHDDGDGEHRAKHLHDVRGTFVTTLCRAGLTDREIADIVAWSPQNVAVIRRTYVDDAAVVVALSERIRKAL